MIKFSGKIVDKIEASYVIIGSASLNPAASRALDILIASNEFKRVGFLETSLIEPAVGYLNKKVDGGQLGLPAEVYQKDEVVIIQLRSNVRMGRKKQFVSEISKLLTTVIRPSTVVIAGSLSYSMRPDLQIQSVSKNAYYYSNLDDNNFKKAEESNILKPLSLLLNEDEQISEAVGEAGFVKSAINSENFPKFAYICVFSETNIDHEAATKLAKAISIVSDRKELGVVDQAILND